MIRVRTVTISLVLCAFAHGASADLQTLEERDVGRWRLVALADEAGQGVLCYAATSGMSAGQFMSVSVERNQGWSLEVTNGKDMRDAAGRELTYSIDGSAAVANSARTIAPSILSVTLGASFESTEPLRRGGRIEIGYSGGRGSFSLKGSSDALDALFDCAVRHLDYRNDADAANPFSASATIGAGDASLNADDLVVDRTLEAVKTLRLARVVFAQDPLAESALRDRLRSARRGAPAGEAQVSAMIEAQAFLYAYVEKAIRVGPSDVLAKLIRLNSDIMQGLQSQPENCAAYFMASTGGLGYLPQDVRLALAEIYADLVDAAAVRPVTKAMIGDEALIAAMAEAYAANGFPADDMTKFDDIATLGPRQTCRLGTQLSIALAWLPEDTAAAIFRQMYAVEP